MPDEQQGRRLFEPEVIRGIAGRLRVQWLLQRFDERKVWAAFMFVNGFVTIGLLSLLALATGTPFVFPSLGPTAFLFFFDPRAPSASPHHAVIGHAIGIACGYGALLLFGLEHAGSAMTVGVDARRVLAAALSLAATGALMILLEAAHPPAGATTLIISLGAIARPLYLLFIEVALVLLVLQAIAINKLAGLDYPLWRPRERPARP
jgi:CBS domain-containing membrane protein